MAWLRIPFRFVAVLLLSVWVAVEFALKKPFVAKEKLPAFRADWLHRCDRKLLWLLGVELEVKGDLPPAALYASNHLSYLDIFIISAVRPVFFVSKDDVKKWPWGGMLANMAGTLYIKRNVRSDIPRITAEIREAHAAGVPIVVFLEANTSDGETVIPFRGALLQPAVNENWPVLPVHLHYQVPGRPAYDGVAWCDETPFLLHLTRLFGLPRIRATLTTATAQTGEDRKALAKSLHEAVLEMHEEAKENQSAHPKEASTA